MAFSILHWQNYTKDCSKLSKKSEGAVDAGRVLKFLFDPELNYVQANVQASMRDRSYSVRVRNTGIL